MQFFLGSREIGCVTSLFWPTCDTLLLISNHLENFNIFWVWETEPKHRFWSADMWYLSLPLLRFVSVSYYANFRRGTPWYDRRSRRSVASRDSLKYIDAIIRLLLRPIKRKMSVPPSQSLAHFPQIRMKWSGGLREAKNSSQKRNSTYSLVKLCDLGMGLVVLRV